MKGFKSILPILKRIEGKEKKSNASTKKHFILGAGIAAIVLAFLVFFSCNSPSGSGSKSNGAGFQAGKVQFQFSNTSFATNAQRNISAYQLRNVEPTPAAFSLLVGISDSSGTVIYEAKKLYLYNLAGGYISEPLPLKTGTFNLTMFMVLDEANNVIYASPLAGSPSAHFVVNPLPLAFSVFKDTVTTMSPEVLSVGASTAKDFGYTTFSFNIVQTVDFLVAVFVPTTNNFELTTANITIVSNSVTLFSGPLAALTNAIKLNNVSTDYSITITKTGYTNYTATFTKAQIQDFYNVPLVVILMPVVLPVGPIPVDLGSAANFAILAGSTITSTGNSIVTGDIGLNPGTTVTGFPPAILNGIFHFADPVAATAQLYLTSAILDATGRTNSITIATELGGTTLNPGVYKSAAGTFGITGTLTLDGKGNADSVFIFQTATTVITAANSSVVLINGAIADNIFWQVGSSATIAANSAFKGNILAETAITLGTGATINGRALAKTAAVTLSSNTITKP